MQRPSVLITGAARRIGATMARRFGANGWHVVIHYNGSHDEAKALAGSLPSAELAQCDLEDDDAAMALVRRLASDLPDWRALILNAAIFQNDSAAMLDPVTYDDAMQVNVKTPIRMAQSYLGLATSRAGRCVIQLTDQKTANANPDFFSYSISKSAVAAAAPMLALGAADPDDRVYNLAPGAILPSYDQTAEEAEHSHRQNLLGRRTDVDEIADAAVFLAGRKLASGSALFVDSGQHLMRQDRDVIFLGRSKELANG